MTAPADSFVGPGLVIEGTVTGRGDLRVAGTLKGTVTIVGMFIIEHGALIDGDVEATTLSVEPGARMRGTAKFGWNARAAT